MNIFITTVVSVSGWIAVVVSPLDRFTVFDVYCPFCVESGDVVVVRKVGPPGWNHRVVEKLKTEKEPCGA